MFRGAVPQEHVRSLLVQAIDPLLLRAVLGQELARRWVPLLERYYTQARRRSPATFLDFDRVWADQRQRWEPIATADLRAGRGCRAGVGRRSRHGPRRSRARRRAAGRPSQPRSGACPASPPAGGAPARLRCALPARCRCPRGGLRVLRGASRGLRPVGARGVVGAPCGFPLAGARLPAAAPLTAPPFPFRSPARGPPPPSSRGGRPGARFLPAQRRVSCSPGVRCLSRCPWRRATGFPFPAGCRGLAETCVQEVDMALKGRSARGPHRRVRSGARGGSARRVTRPSRRRATRSRPSSSGAPKAKGRGRRAASGRCSPSRPAGGSRDLHHLVLRDDLDTVGAGLERSLADAALLG